MLQSVVFWPNSPAFSYANLRAHRGFAFDGKGTCNVFLSSVLARSHQSLHHISPDNFTIISSCRSNSNFELLRERVYWYRNLDPLSTKTSHPYPFLYFSFTQPSFSLCLSLHFILSLLSCHLTSCHFNPIG